jgi:WS/DGAT/MGAT family acyltransferase
LTTGKRVAWSAPIPLARFQVVRQGLGATLNDVVLNALAGGLRRYLRDEGFETRDLDVRAVVPVSLRPVSEMAELGNQFGLIFLSLPLGIADPRERMTELRRRMKKLKRSVEPWVTYKVLGIIGRLPKLVQNLVIRIFGTKGTAVVTSVPGPCRELYLAGEAIRGIAFWVPQSGRLGLGVSIISYAGALRLGVASDTGVVADPARIVQAFEEELGAVIGPPERGASATGS